MLQLRGDHEFEGGRAGGGGSGERESGNNIIQYLHMKSSKIHTLKLELIFGTQSHM